LAVAVLVGWLGVRLWTWLRSDPDTPAPTTPGPTGWVRAQAAAVRGSGGLVMLAAMTTMVA
jgi:hypothetical protein